MIEKHEHVSSTTAGWVAMRGRRREGDGNDGVARTRWRGRYAIQQMNKPTLYVVGACWKPDRSHTAAAPRIAAIAVRLANILL